MNIQNISNKEHIGEKLDSVKSLLIEILSTINSKDDKINNVILKKTQTLYAKRQQVQKQNKVLLYQVNLLYKLLTSLEIDQQQQIFQLNKQSFDSQIILTQKNQKLQNKIAAYQQKSLQCQKQKQQLLKKIQILEKNIKINAKKVGQFEKIGGINKYNQMKEKIKQLQMKNNDLIISYQNSQQQIKKLSKKCKILQQLNKQTEDKMADLMLNKKNKVGKQNVSQNTQKISKVIQQQQVRDNKNSKIELFAAKQQIRNLKLKIEALQRQKQTQKIRYEQKQSIYEKFVMKNLRN